MRDHGLERHESCPSGRSGVEALGHLDPAKRLLVGLGVERDHAEGEREPRRAYGNGWPGPTASGVRIG